MLHVSSSFINRLRVTEKYSKKIKLRAKEITRMKELKGLGLTLREISKIYSVTPSTVWRVVNAVKPDLSAYDTKPSLEKARESNKKYRAYKLELYEKGLIQ